MKRLLLVILAVTAILSSCENADKAQLTGVWHSDPVITNEYSSRCDGEINFEKHYDIYDYIEFVNHNTCHFDSGITNRKHIDCRHTSYPCPFKEGWSDISYNGTCGTFTYYILENKVFLSNGTILTIVDDNTLLMDGSSKALHKSKIF